MSGTLDDIPNIELEGEPENEGGDEKPIPQIAEITKELAARMRKKAEDNKGEIYPAWDPVNQGQGARMIGTLVEKRVIKMRRGDKPRDAPLMVIDIGPQPAYSVLTKDGKKTNTGPITVWCGKVLERHYDKAQIGKLTYIEYQGKVQGQGIQPYNNFIFCQIEPGEAPQAEAEAT